MKQTIRTHSADEVVAAIKEIVESGGKVTGLTERKRALLFVRLPSEFTIQFEINRQE